MTSATAAQRLAATLLLLSIFAITTGTDHAVVFGVRDLTLAFTGKTKQPAHLPDLLPAAVAVTAAGAALILLLTRRRQDSAIPAFCRYLLLSLPATNILKALAKDVIGRVSSRVWLDHPSLQEFHWFHGKDGYNSFPSGHMAIAAVVAYGAWLHFPGARCAACLATALLGCALVATGYHFLSDVLAGAALGLWVGTLTERLAAARAARQATLNDNPRA